MIPRTASNTLERLAKGFPVVALTGPRQSGKTTLAKSVFKDKPYVALENPDEREFALRDPKRFLQRFPSGAILDEVQRCPELLPWLQGWVDERGIWVTSSSRARRNLTCSRASPCSNHTTATLANGW